MTSWLVLKSAHTWLVLKRPVTLDRELKELDVLKKRAEVDTQTRDLEAKNSWSARWNNPVALAVIAAMIGYLGILVT